MTDFPGFNRGSSRAWVKQNVRWRERLAEGLCSWFIYHCFPLFAWWKLQGLFRTASTELNTPWELFEWEQEKKQHVGDDWELGVFLSFPTMFIVIVIVHQKRQNEMVVSMTVIFYKQQRGDLKLMKMRKREN